MSQVFVDGRQFLIIHSSDRTPRHLSAELAAIGIDAGAHGGNEFRELPVPDQIEVGSERTDLPRHAAGQARAVALAAILIRQDVLAELKGRALRRRRDAAGDDRLAARQALQSPGRSQVGRLSAERLQCPPSALIEQNGWIE